MPIPTLKKQILGDFEKQLNKIRNKMNQDIADKCLEIIEKRKQNMKKKIFKQAVK